MITATLTSKGQITIPKNIREQLDLHAGDKLSFVADDDGTINLVPVRLPMSALKGLITKPKKPVSIDEMNATVKRRSSRT